MKGEIHNLADRKSKEKPQTGKPGDADKLHRLPNFASKLP